MNEAEIIAQIKAGNSERFGDLYDAYFQKIYNYLFYRTHDREITEDLTSTTFLKAVKHLGNFNARKGNFSAWIYRIARNTLYDHYRGKKDVEQLENIEEPSDGTNIEKDVLDKQLVTFVKDNFDRLSEDQRSVITMRIWDELAYIEIADILGKTEASCKTIYHRGIMKLKEIVV